MSVDEFRAQFAERAGIEPPEAPAEEAETAEETEVTTEETSTERARNEKGQFTTTDTGELEEPEPKLLAGKYKDTDALEQGYEELRQQFNARDAEVSELRALREQFDQFREELSPRETPQYDPSSLDDFLTTNPHQIPVLAQQAIDANDGYLYQRALAAWGEIDQIGAMDFHARKVSEANMAQLREELAPTLQGVQRMNTNNEFAAAYETAAQKHDDFTPVMNSITQTTLDGFPKEVLGILQTGDTASKERVLETLYRWTKAEQAGNLTEAAESAARQTHEESVAARQDAVVASTTTSQDRGVVKPVDAWREQFQGSAAFRKAAGLT